MFNLAEERGRKQEDDTDCITHVDPTETTSFITKGERREEKERKRRNKII